MLGSRFRGRHSLERELPLIMTAVLASGLTAMLAITYVTLIGRAEGIVRDRLRHAVREMASQAEAPLAERAQSLRTAARAPAVTAALLARRENPAATPPETQLAAARSSIERNAPPGAGLPTELWDDQGRVVAAIGTPVPDALRPRPPSAPAGSDSVRVSRLYRVGDQVRFWIFAPVIVDGARVGWVAQPRKVSGGRNAERFISEMLREQATLILRNADGTVWATAPGKPTDAPERRRVTPAGVMYDRAGVGEVVAEETPIAGAPWVMVLESPREWILARPKPTIKLLATLCLALIVVGAAVSWRLSRRITKPLAQLTDAAETVALGTYDRPLAMERSDEIGRLAASFDEMARRVRVAQRELEKRAADSDASAAELAEANQQLREAMQEVERATRAKGDFLAMMSHELRTPLNAIGGYAELIDMGIHGPVTEAQREALARLGRNKAHLLALIDHVLNFGRITAGQVGYDIADINLADALTGIESAVEPQLVSRRISLTNRQCDRAVFVRADREKLRQIMVNLLSNGAKYTPEGGSIVIDCDFDDQRVRVHVRDTGPGIAPERLNVIFEPFVQGERALSRPNEGVGLGLTISRDLARGMGAEVSVKSEPGNGAIFTITLDRARVPARSLPHSSMQDAVTTAG